MARIPNEELARFKRDVDLVALVEAKGVKLEKRGADLHGRCPFHADKTPSLVVTPAKNVWHCLGKCQTGGSVIDWVMKAEAVSFRHAVELLRAKHTPTATTAKTARKLPPPVDVSAADQELLDQVAGYYHATLKESPEALAYLEKRGLASSEMIDHFKLGFANRTLGYRLPQANRVAGEELRTRLTKVGVIRESGHEHLNGSLVIPIVDEDGHVQGIYGRKITDHLRAGTPLHLYLPGPHRGVFNVEALKASTEIVLCEALIDALTFWCAGIRNVTNAYGVEGFTDEIFAAFQKHGTKRVLIAYDKDDAGDAAAAKLAPRLIAAGIEVFRVQFPKGMDANEYALKVKPAAKSLAVVVERAERIGGPETKLATKEETSPSSLVASPPTAQAPTSTAGFGAVDVGADEVTITLGDRRYRVRGLAKNTTLDVLRVNVLAAKGESFHVDTLDLYAAKQRVAFITATAHELSVNGDVIKADLGRVMRKLEELQDAHMKALLDPKPAVVEMSDDERERALELLRDPKLLDRILVDFEKCGITGEETNKLTGYLAAVSRKLEDPLAVIIQSTSAAGKSALMEAVLAFMPDEDKTKYSAMTGQSLFYMGELDLKHKILAIVEEEGAERASYALKLLQSEKELTIASTGKDPETGKHVTHEYRVEGPVMIFLTTTAIEIDEELLNRCLVLTVDEDREQTRAIHALQRRRQTLEGLLARHDRDTVLAVHKNAQRLLRPLLVANPFAERLTFLDDKTRTRRDHMKYLTLIRSIALLHQHQRATKTVAHNGTVLEYIEATLDDVATANKLAHEVLGRSLDELPPQTRKLLMLLDEMVGAVVRDQEMDRCDVRFTRRNILDVTGWGYTQAKLHLERLVEHELVLVHHGGRGQSFEYELLFDGKGDSGAPMLPGLIDVDALRADGTTTTLRGSEGGFAGALRPLRGPVAGPSRGAVVDEKPASDAKNAGHGRNGASSQTYVQARS